MQEALDWVYTVTGKRVTRVRRLLGGITSDVRAVTLAGGETLVLRRYAAWGREAAKPVAREAATLERLVRSDLPAPRLVAARPEGDVPMLLMTRLPGRVWLTPPDPDTWLAQMARTLAAVHATPTMEPARERPPIDPAPLAVPDWTRRAELWKRAGAILSTPPEPITPVFVHSDYQHFNMLWARGRLTGLIDWVFAETGHPDIDTAHCRLNLAVLFSVDHAERFRVLYEAESGRMVDPWWDLRGLSGYGQDWKQFIPVQVAGRAAVDAAGMDDRIEGLMDRILRRM
ncbi:MAG: phosphotransferase [Gemmatimonadales bacterium]|nr:phosphotransferase [Gemmatimonadales bacterium]